MNLQTVSISGSTGVASASSIAKAHLSIHDKPEVSKEKIHNIHVPMQNAFLDLFEMLRDIQASSEAKNSQVDVLKDKMLVLEGMECKVNDLIALQAKQPFDALENKIEELRSSFDERLKTLEHAANLHMDKMNGFASEVSVLKDNIDRLSANLKVAENFQKSLSSPPNSPRPGGTRPALSDEARALTKNLKAAEARIAELEKHRQVDGELVEQQMANLEGLLKEHKAEMADSLFQLDRTQESLKEELQSIDARTLETIHEVESLRAMSNKQSAKLTALDAVFENRGHEFARIAQESREHQEYIKTLQKEHRSIEALVSDFKYIREQVQQKVDKPQFDAQRQDLEQSLKVIRSTMVRSLSKFEQFMMSVSGTTTGQVAQHDKLIGELKSEVQQLVVQERLAQFAATTHCLSCFQDHRSASPPPNRIRGAAGFPSDQVDEHLVVLPKSSSPSIPKAKVHPNGMSPFQLQESEKGALFGDSPQAQIAKGAKILADATKSRPSSANRGRAIRPQSAKFGRLSAGQPLPPTAQSKDSHAPADMRT